MNNQTVNCMTTTSERNNARVKRDACSWTALRLYFSGREVDTGFDSRH